MLRLCRRGLGVHRWIIGKKGRRSEHSVMSRALLTVHIRCDLRMNGMTSTWMMTMKIWMKIRRLIQGRKTNSIYYHLKGRKHQNPITHNYKSAGIYTLRAPAANHQPSLPPPWNTHSWDLSANVPWAQIILYHQPAADTPHL